MIFYENSFKSEALLLNILICIRPRTISLTIAKTGLLNLRSSCLDAIIVCFEYIKKAISTTKFVIPGAKKNLLIDTTLASRIQITIGA